MIDRRFRKTRVYECRVRPTEFAADLKLIIAAQARRAGVIEFWTALNLVVWGIAITGIAVGALWPPAYLAFVVMLPIGFWTTRRVVLTLPIVCEERRHRIPEALLKCLACDMHPRGRTAMRIDFNFHDDDRFQVQRRDVGKVLAFIDYQQDWLSMEGSLLDGTRFRLRIRRQASHKVRFKTRGRTKIKTAFREIASLALKVPAQHYGDAAPCGPLVENSHVPGDLILRKVRAGEGVLAIRAMTDWQVVADADREKMEAAAAKLFTVETVLWMFLTCFDALNRVRVRRRAA